MEDSQIFLRFKRFNRSSLKKRVKFFKRWKLLKRIEKKGEKIDKNHIVQYKSNSIESPLRKNQSSNWIKLSLNCTASLTSNERGAVIHSDSSERQIKILTSQNRCWNSLIWKGVCWCLNLIYLWSNVKVNLFFSIDGLEMRGLSALVKPINVCQKWNLLGNLTQFSTQPQVFWTFVSFWDLILWERFF